MFKCISYRLKLVHVVWVAMLCLSDRSSVADDRMKTTTIDDDAVSLLFLISQYARALRQAGSVICPYTYAPDETFRSLWIRETSLMVVAHHCRHIIYSDCISIPWTVPTGRRTHLCVSSRLLNDLNRLREMRYLDCVGLTTENGVVSKGFQVTRLGLKVCENAARKLSKVNQALLEAVYPPLKGEWGGGPSHRRYVPSNLVHSRFCKGSNKDEDASFILTNGLKSVNFKSEVINETPNDMLYGPFLPSILRSRKISYNAASKQLQPEPAYSFKMGISAQASTCTESVYLDGVHVIIFEFIPGMSQSYIQRLALHVDSIQKCEFTAAETLKRGSLSQVHGDNLRRGLNIRELDYASSPAFINFIVTRCLNRSFALHVPETGFVGYGTQTVDRESYLASTKKLSCFLVNLQRDLSVALAELLSQNQRYLLEAMGVNQSDGKFNYNAFFACDIRPFYDGSKVEKDQYSQLGTLVGPVFSVRTLPDNHLIVQGANGCLFVGPSIGHSYKNRQLSEDVKSCVTIYAAMASLDIFLRQFYSRIQLSNAICQRMKADLHARVGPDIVARAQKTIFRVNISESILFKALCEAKSSFKALTRKYESIILNLEQSEPLAESLAKVLDFRRFKNDLMYRLRDLDKLILGAQRKMKWIQRQANLAGRDNLFVISRSIDKNFSLLKVTSRRVRKQYISQDMIGIVFVGKLAFDILDRLVGGEFMGNQRSSSDNSTKLENPSQWFESTFAPILEIPLVWFLLNMLWLLTVVGSFRCYLRGVYQESCKSGSLTKRDLNIDLNNVDCLARKSQVTSIKQVRGQILTEYTIHLTLGSAGYYHVRLLVDTNLRKLREIKASWSSKDHMAQFHSDAAVVGFILKKIHE